MLDLSRPEHLKSCLFLMDQHKILEFRCVVCFAPLLRALHVGQIVNVQSRPASLPWPAIRHKPSDEGRSEARCSLSQAPLHTGRYLTQSSSTITAIRCNFCASPYILQTAQHWIQSVHSPCAIPPEHLFLRVANQFTVAGAASRRGWSSNRQDLAKVK